ncbi:MAG TPA: hypothetical protein VNR87_05085 [Flavisolibacter sp.]|nr:hypothetical protein [Flavisolibacter sp.]
MIFLPEAIHVSRMQSSLHTNNISAIGFVFFMMASGYNHVKMYWFITKTDRKHWNEVPVHYPIDPDTGSPKVKKLLQLKLSEDFH